MKIVTLCNIFLCSIMLVTSSVTSVANQTSLGYSSGSQSKNAIKRMKNNIVKCTSLFRSAIENNFVKEGDIKNCNSSVSDMRRHVVHMKHASMQFARGVSIYQEYYSSLYMNREMLRKNYKLVNKIIASGKAVRLRSLNVRNILHKKSGKQLKNHVYLNNTINTVLDRLISNAEGMLNLDTENDDRLKKQKRMVKDVLMSDKLINVMLQGDEEFKVKKINDKQARRELESANRGIALMRNNTTEWLELGPDIFSLWDKFNRLQNITVEIDKL